MSRFNEYSTLLEIECSVDYWSDQAIDEAVQHLENFDESDWEELNHSLRSKSSVWQTRCAETMSEAPQDRGVPVLMSLLDSSNDDILEATVDSLNSFSQAGAIIDFSESENVILNNLIDRGGLVGTVAARLLGV